MPAVAQPKYRVWSTETQAWVELAPALDSLSRADVVFVGEIHDHAPAHALEQALLEGLYARRPDLALGFEMFERDVQPVLDGYLAGAVEEPDFLARSRPWNNYPSDYRPLVEFAKAHGLRALATNVPRSLAAQVAASGLEALKTQPTHTRRLFARLREAPLDAYYQRFAERAARHPHGAPEAVLRYYQAQCLKDDTMAESVADHLESVGSPAPLVLHFNGAFHSDFGLGVAARTRTRRPGARVAVVSLVPAEDLEAVKPEEKVGQADFLVFYPAPPEAAEEGPARPEAPKQGQEGGPR